MAVAATMAQLLALTRMPPRYRAVIGLLALLMYVLVTGYSPSAVRAYAMVFFFWSSRAFQRQPNAFSALVNSAIAVLLWDPRQIWLPGFQLSYCVVGGLITYAVFLQNTAQWRDFKANWLPWRTHQHQKPWWIHGMVVLYKLFTISLTASLFSAPMIISYFGLFSPGAIFLNMLLVPLAGLVVATGCLVMLFGILSLDSLVLFYNHAAWTMIAVMELKIDLALSFPGYFQNRQWPHPVTGPLLSFFAVALSAGLREAYRKNQTTARFTIIAPILLVFGGILLGSLPVSDE
jgi:competence protein ComEC